MNIDFQINTICNFLRENALCCKKDITQLHRSFTENRAYNFTFYLKDKKTLTVSAEHFHYGGWTRFSVDMNGMIFYIDPRGTTNYNKYKILDGFFHQIDALATELYHHNNNKIFLKMFH
jgi:hypothetical protein